MKLRWEKQGSGQRESWWAYSGELVIGMVGYVDEQFRGDDGPVFYKQNEVRMKYIGKGSGHVSSISAGKRAIERGWRQWLTAAGLAHPLQNSWHTFRQSVNPAKATVSFTFNTSEELDRALNDLGSAAKWEHVE